MNCDIYETSKIPRGWNSASNYVIIECTQSVWLPTAWNAWRRLFHSDGILSLFPIICTFYLYETRSNSSKDWRRLEVPWNWPRLIWRRRRRRFRANDCRFGEEAEKGTCCKANWKRRRSWWTEIGNQERYRDERTDPSSKGKRWRNQFYQNWRTNCKRGQPMRLMVSMAVRTGKFRPIP